MDIDTPPLPIPQAARALPEHCLSKWPEHCLLWVGRAPQSSRIYLPLSLAKDHAELAAALNGDSSLGCGRLTNSFFMTYPEMDPICILVQTCRSLAAGSAINIETGLDPVPDIPLEIIVPFVPEPVSHHPLSTGIRLHLISHQADPEMVTTYLRIPKVHPLRKIFSTVTQTLLGNQARTVPLEEIPTAPDNSAI